jgi:hypothetical protein
MAVVGACAEKKGALILAINTDMKAPKDVNAVSVTISTDGVVKHSFIGRVTPQGEVLLPATLAIVEPDNKSASIRVRVMAFQERKPRVLRDVRTTIPTGGRTALLRIPLNFVNDNSAVGAPLPSGVVPAPIPGTEGPPVDGGTSSGDLPSTGVADFDFVGAYQPPCPDPKNQTIIDGECKDSFVDPATLPDFDAAEVGDGTNAGTCFDLAKCFGAARAVADGELDRNACTFSLGSLEPARLNLALVTPDTGDCLQPGQCYVPLERGPAGWQATNGRAQLPPFVCKLLTGKSLQLVVESDGACAAKEERDAICTAKAGAIVDSGPVAPSTPPLIAESFATTVAVSNGVVYFAGATRVASASLTDLVATAFPVQPSKSPWRFGGTAPTVALVNGGATGYILTRQGLLVTPITVAPGTVGAGNAPNGDLAWAVELNALGGVYTSGVTGAATKVALPIPNATALVSLSDGSGVLTGAVVGDSTGTVRACDFASKSCGNPSKLPAAGRVQSLTGEGQNGFTLAPDGVYHWTLQASADAGSSSSDISAPILLRAAKTATLVDGAVNYDHEITLDTKCLYFSSADGLEWVTRDGSQHGLLATPAAPVLGVTQGPAAGRTDGNDAIYYTVFAPKEQGGGVYRVALPQQCAVAPVGDAGADASAGTCPTTTPIDQTKYPWKSPTQTLNACTQPELDQLVAYFAANPNTSYQAAKQSVANSTCQNCIFALDSASTWAPLMSSDGVNYSVNNVGGCIALETNDPCGKAYQQWWECDLEACTGCPSGDQTALNACNSNANNGVCKNALAALNATCGAPLAAAQAKCQGTKFAFEGSVKAQCITLP